MTKRAMSYFFYINMLYAAGGADGDQSGADGDQI
jgi:hypothetical protein